MTADPRSLAVRRILFAQGLAGLHRPALEIAVALAARHHAELANLIVEDLELQRAAAMPAAIEILRHTGEHRPLRALELAGSARAQADALRRELKGRGGLKWTLRIIQGPYPATPASSLAPNELLILARPSRSGWPTDSARAPVLLVYADPADQYRLQTLASELTSHDPGLPRQLEIVPRPDPVLLHRALRVHRPGLILASADPQLLKPEVLRQLLEDADCPVILQA